MPVDGGTVEQTKLNQQLAQRIYSAMKGDVARSQYHLCIRKPTILFREFRAWFEREVLPRKRNQVRDRSMLRQLGHTFDNVYLHDITRPQIEEWITARGKDVSPGTVNRELIRLKSFLSAAVPTYLDGSPAARIRDVDEDEFEPRILEEADEKKLLLAATAEECALLICALDTLQRLSNVAALERKDDHGGYLTVLRPKGTGKRRYYEVPISPRLRAALDAVPKDGTKYFRSYQGGSVEAVRKRVEQAFAALCGRAAVPYGRKIGGLTFHSLRHTGASRMLNRGADIKTVAEIGNWKDWRILQRYLHPIGDARERAVALVGAGVQPVNPKRPKARK